MNAPLVARTRTNSCNGSSNSMDYCLIATSCNEEPLTFQYTYDDQDWISAMQSKIDEPYIGMVLGRYVNCQKGKISFVQSGFTILRES